MQAIVIKQAQGLWTVETSGGVRWAGASLESVIEKVASALPGYEAFDTAAFLEALFARIPDSQSGNVAHGVAGA